MASRLPLLECGKQVLDGVGIQEQGHGVLFSSIRLMSEQLQILAHMSKGGRGANKPSIFFYLNLCIQIFRTLGQFLLGEK